MLMAIDVGNTNITIGFFKGDELVASYRMTTKTRRTSDEYGLDLFNFIEASGLNPQDVKGCIVSSVVPKVMHSFRNAIIKFFAVEPIVVGPGIKTGISVQLENPPTVGADRIADCAGAYAEYGGPILVVDFGTATTYDYVDEHGHFKYGVIGVGIESGANALWGNTAQLPEVEIKRPKTILTKNTQAEMQAGIFYQTLGGFEMTVKQFKKELNRDFKVIATGGLGRVICSYTDVIDVYDPNLIFKGLKIIYDKTKADQEKKKERLAEKALQDSLSLS